MKIHYHSDHLGSASFVTDIGGNVVQHLQYLPYGEIFVSQRNSEKFDSRYKFTSKELDNETSYTYFGARYYDSELSGWLSVDPMSDKYPSLSPYCYSADNPVVLVDPNGMCIDEATDVAKSFFKGISNVLNGRPWGARHKTNLVKREQQKSEWAYLRSGGGMVTESYLNQLHSKVLRYYAGEENLAWSGRLMNEINKSITHEISLANYNNLNTPYEIINHYDFSEYNVKISEAMYYPISPIRYTNNMVLLNSKLIYSQISYSDFPKYPWDPHPLSFNMRNKDLLDIGLQTIEPGFGESVKSDDTEFYYFGSRITHTPVVISDFQYKLKFLIK